MMRKALLEIDEANTAEALEGLRTEWSGLVRNCVSATPFQSPAWLIPWWKWFGSGKPMVVTIRAGGRLAGLAPLYINTDDNGERVVRFMGTGLSDYLDAVFEPGIEIIGADAVLRRIAERSASWDRCDLQEIREGSFLLSAGLPGGLEGRMTEQGVCPVLYLPGTAGELERMFSHDGRTGARRAMKRLKLGSVAEAASADKATLSSFMDSLFELHCARWRNLSLQGVLADGQIQSFHREVAEGMLEEGMLRLYRLRYNGEDAAVVYGFALHKRFYSYLGGFDPRLSKLSPGRALMRHVMTEAAGEGIKEFDFLRGSEPYKYGWGAKDRINARLQISTGGWNKIQEKKK